MGFEDTDDVGEGDVEKVAEVGEDAADELVEEDAGEASEYFIMQTRCQPGMPDWDGRLWTTPVHWKGP